MTWIVDDEHLGTPDARWRDWGALRRAPAMDWGPPGRVVVVSPHPDDEVLAIGATMRQLARRGAEIHIVAVTEGEGSHPQSPTLTRAQMAQRRAAERATALAVLGLRQLEVTRLHIADGRVSIDAALVERLLLAIVRGATWCLAPWMRDGHPDHDAVGRAASVACAATGTPLVFYPVWAWHWSTPSRGDLPETRIRRIVLDADDLRAKRSAVRAFTSQIAPLSPDPRDAPVLPAAVLERFDRPFEVVFV